MPNRRGSRLAARYGVLAALAMVVALAPFTGPVSAAEAVPASEAVPGEAPAAQRLPAFYPGVGSQGAGEPMRERLTVIEQGPVWEQRVCSEEIPGLCFCLPDTEDTCDPVNCDKNCGSGEPPPE